MYTTETAEALTPTSWFSNLYFHSQNETKSNSSSGQEVFLPMESSASISVLRIPTYIMITQTFSVCNHDQHDTSRTLTIPN